MTQILNLPLLSFAMTIANNESWVDSWAYIDAASSPISLAGLTLVMMVRDDPESSVVRLAAASASGVIVGVVPTGLIATGGAGLNVLALDFSKDVVSNLSEGSYTFEVQATGDGFTRRIATGPLIVTQGIVR